MSASEEISEIGRAEDILPGALGFSEDASLQLVRVQERDLILEGVFCSDSQKFSAVFDYEIGDLERWAVAVLRQAGKVVDSDKS